MFSFCFTFAFVSLKNKMEKKREKRNDMWLSLKRVTHVLALEVIETLDMFSSDLILLLLSYVQDTEYVSKLNPPLRSQIISATGEFFVDSRPFVLLIYGFHLDGNHQSWEIQNEGKFGYSCSYKLERKNRRLEYRSLLNGYIVDPDDVTTVVTQANCTRYDAIHALLRYKNVIDAILELTP